MRSQGDLRPCVYILLTHNSQDIYLEAYIFLNSLLDFMADFEKAFRKRVPLDILPLDFLHLST